MMGYVEKERLAELIQESHALILPSQVYEGFPMTIAESFSLGVPVVGSDLGNVGNLVVNYENGLKFVHNSSDDLAEKCKEALDRPIVVKKEYLDKYSSENNYHQLLSIYNSIIERQK